MERTLQTNGKAAQKLLECFHVLEKTHPVLKNSTISSPIQSCEVPVRYSDDPAFYFHL